MHIVSGSDARTVVETEPINVLLMDGSEENAGHITELPDHAHGRVFDVQHVSRISDGLATWNKTAASR